MSRLTITEKTRIEKLYLCERALLETDLKAELNRELLSGTEVHNNKIDELTEQIKIHQKLINNYTAEHKFGHIDSYGCMRSHPKLDEFRSETNAQLMKLWGNEVTTL